MMMSRSASAQKKIAVSRHKQDCDWPSLKRARVAKYVLLKGKSENLRFGSDSTLPGQVSFGRYEGAGRKTVVNRRNSDGV